MAHGDHYSGMQRIVRWYTAIKLWHTANSSFSINSMGGWYSCKLCPLENCRLSCGNQQAVLWHAADSTRLHSDALAHTRQYFNTHQTVLCHTTDSTLGHSGRTLVYRGQYSDTQWTVLQHVLRQTADRLWHTANSTLTQSGLDYVWSS
jgi:hypothetical protein